MSTGKRALFMAKQLAFQERLWNGPAINRDKWPVFPMALLVNGLCHQFFSRSTLANNQHRNIRPRHPSNRIERLWPSPDWSQ